MSKLDLPKVRNIGISAHIDSGKTTLTERILFYSGKIHKIGEIRTTEGATMDSMDLEREKGITIQSAATTVGWKLGEIEHTVNIIDTPGHVDFTVEVERSLRVLDGAILVLCGVGGVQSQSLTVDRQMKRYGTPRICFINKLDRAGANPDSVIKQIRSKLGLHAVPLQITMGLESNLEGIIDLIQMKAYYFDGEKGETVREEAIPEEHLDRAKEARQAMLEELSHFNDTMVEMLLDEKEVPLDLIYTTIREATLALKMAPVMMGSAYKNKGVQLLLDGVARYLPSPLDRKMTATDVDRNEKIPLAPEDKLPLVGMGFKLVLEKFGQVTYFRIYQGRAMKGGQYINSRTGNKQRFSRILRIHADEKEDIDSAGAGDIVGIVGIDCASGDTYCSEGTRVALENIYAPAPVISLAVEPAKRVDMDKMTQALQRFRREDPTFHVGSDPETFETIISGMGELHLEIYLERIKREYNVEVVASPPKVSYRESPQQKTNYDYKHKKQTGGSGQYGHVVGYMEPYQPEDGAEESSEFVNKVTGGRIPNEFIPSVEKGFRKMIDKGPMGGFPVVNLRIVLEDGSYHDVDSSDMAFQVAAMDCFREYFSKTKPVLLEPIMKVEVEVPADYQGPVNGDLSRRRGVIENTDSREGTAVVTAFVPLAEMFGYSTDLRSATAGKGTFTMEFARYERVPGNVQEDVLKKVREMNAQKKK